MMMNGIILVIRATPVILISGVWRGVAMDSPFAQALRALLPLKRLETARGGRTQGGLSVAVLYSLDTVRCTPMILIP
jgi:hypothetical protein